MSTTSSKMLTIKKMTKIRRMMMMKSQMKASQAVTQKKMTQFTREHDREEYPDFPSSYR